MKALLSHGMRLLAATCIFLCTTEYCVAQSQLNVSHEMLNSALWQKSSAEYYAAASQSYLVARIQLDRALEDSNWTASLEQEGDYRALPPAIILDIDETVLDNSCYQARIVGEYGQYSPKTWLEWVNEAKAPAVPGSVAFLKYAREKGVAVFFVTGRETDQLKGTTENMIKVGLPAKPDGSNLLLNDGSTTSERRRKIAQKHRILLIVGDNVNDFIDGTRTTPADRKKIAIAHTTKFGVSWIMLPNAMYGHWEASFYQFDYSKPRKQILEIKHKALDCCRSSSKKN